MPFRICAAAGSARIVLAAAIAIAASAASADALTDRARALLAGKDAKGATAALPATFSLIDRSAKWGIIKKNTAARYKSRITLRLKALAA